jgi:transposase
VYQGVCDCGEAHCAAFPLGVNARAQYGDSVRAVVAYLSKYQLIPYERVQEMMGELFKTPLSEGTVDNICKRGVSGLETFEMKVKDELLDEKSLHVDETPIRVEGGKGYLHVASSKALSFLSYHRKRGMEAVKEIGVLEKFKGLLVHDCFSMYFNYGGGHVICNAHLLRELTFIEEKYAYRWAHELKIFLLDTKGLVDQYKGEGLTHLHHSDSDRLALEFELILLRGRSEMKELIAKVQNRGKSRGKQHPALNLGNRMLRLKGDILRFMYDFDLPFTNNEAERDLRMAKVHMKISGCCVP